MNDHPHHGSGAVAIFSFLGMVALEGVSVAKIVTAFVIAIATGAGYRLGTWLVSPIVERLRKPKEKQQ